MSGSTEKFGNGRPVRGVLFDFDGVLAFTDRYHYLAWKHIADEQGWNFDERINRKCRGVPRFVSLQIILDANGVVCSGDEKQRLATRKNRFYLKSLSQLSEDDLYPGIIEFLKRLKTDGLKLAVCSSSRNAGAALWTLGLMPYFDAVIEGGAVALPKPAPDIFLLGARELSLSPEECIVFEDAESGVVAALAAGMTCIGVGADEDLAAAHLCVTSYSSPALAWL